MENMPCYIRDRKAFLEIIQTFVFGILYQNAPWFRHLLHLRMIISTLVSTQECLERTARGV